MWIIMENKAQTQVLGAPSAPFENALAARCARARTYWAVTHPSLPNYLALTSGSAHGVSDDAGPASHPIAGASLFSETAAAGRSWASYLESMPAPCFQASTSLYAVKHNPAAYYTALGATCAAQDVPLGTLTAGPFVTALARGTLPAFSLVVPNICNDSHDCSVATGDRWLSAWVTAITNSSTYRAGRTALFITWDEDDSSAGNRVALLAIAPSIRPGTAAAGAFGHLSLLHTTELMLGLPARLATTAPDMRSALRL